ncbi:hypothetical protein FD754_015998 [Muntiacus muntjak]|uniref:SAM-dependent methyltransferase TRM5/TYW2-type domain-containing protein n=1 Tax=Muntiacus muntjak TaxID=9888 RepID=A0A5N3VPG2_MUNMU|nr:hypothetical protein FD754_015998 [Muntiacus muntjak]
MSSLILLPWASLIEKLSRAAGIFLLDQRERFSILPEIERLSNHRDSELFSLHSNVQGMTELDRTACKKTGTIPEIKHPGLKCVIEDPEDEEGRLFRLDPYKMFTVDSFEEEELSILKQPNLEKILRAMLPEVQDVTSGFKNNYTYEFDFSKVSWNPCLSTEHNHITELLKPGDVLFDVFTGTGPLAIPAAKKNCTVFASDVNPESCKWLLHNCKLDKFDGKDFLQGPVREELMQQLGPLSNGRKHSVRIVMNLTAKAIEFLTAFKAFLDGSHVAVSSFPLCTLTAFPKMLIQLRMFQKQAGTIVNQDNHEDSPLKCQRTDKDF